jgi:hypothetical protein
MCTEVLQCWWERKTQNEDIVVRTRVKYQQLLPRTEDNHYHRHHSLPSVEIQIWGLQHTK